MNATGIKPFGKGVLDTLAQNRTSSRSNRFAIVAGMGANIDVDGKMKSWAKRKTITQILMQKCIDAAKRKGASDRVKQYWNTYYCLNEIHSSDGRVYGKYCKNRFCQLCRAIRKAKQINQYYPVLKEWNKPYFVTITIRAITKKNLSKFMRGMITAFQKIEAKLQKQRQRGTGSGLVGIRTLECNYNPEKGTYNPHFHLIVQTEDMAELLVDEWLRIWTPKWAGPQGQDIRPVEDLEERLIELIKYGTKIFTDPEPSTKKTKREKRSTKIYVSAFDNINAAMNRMRLFERVGFNLPEGTTTKEPKFQILFEFEKWKYDMAFTDWFSEDIESGLSGFAIDSFLQHSLDEVNTVSE